MEGGINGKQDDADRISVYSTSPLEHVVCFYKERGVGNTTIESQVGLIVRLV